MPRAAKREIGLGAVLVVAFLGLSTLAAADERCPDTSTSSGNWGYLSDWCCTFAVTADQATVDLGATATFTIECLCP